MCNRQDIELGGCISQTEISTQPLLKTPSNNNNSSSTTPSKRRHSDNSNLQSNKDAGFGSAFLDTLPQSQQMMLLSLAMFFFFGMHNVLQEAIVGLLSQVSESVAASSSAGGVNGEAGGGNISGGNMKAAGTIMLGYAEVTGVLLFSYLERIHIAKERGFTHVAPLKAYPLLTLCLFASSALCNMSLSHISFPTKVVFRSCKLVPTMVIATCVNKKVFAGYEYGCALAICAGLALFAMADYTLDPVKFDSLGLVLVSGSVVADAILPNAQERLFRSGSSRLEVTVFSNLFSFMAMTVMTLGNGTLFKFFMWMGASPTLAVYFAVYTVLSYISISCYMTLVKRFGGVSAVLLTTARKAMTLVLSFLLFPKGFSWLYVHGSFLVLGAVMIASVMKKLGAGKKAQPSSGASAQLGEKYNLSYREEDDGTSSSSGSSSSSLKESPRPTSRTTQEQEVEAILNGISKRVYV
jgi:adenosine 3'-phospho 5'-phosphosulfate transporter B3